MSRILRTSRQGAGVSILVDPKTVRSKQKFVPDSGPQVGLLIAIESNRKGEPRVLEVETVAGTFQASVAKKLRAPLSLELETGMAVRLWLRNKGGRLRVELAVPLEAKKMIHIPGCSQKEACIWVCTSKSCCRRGSSEVLEALQEAVLHQQAEIRVKKCGCLGTCKRGPSLKVRGDRKVHQVSPRSAEEFLQRVLNRN